MRVRSVPGCLWHCLTILTLWRVAQGQNTGAIIGADNTVLGVGPEGYLLVSYRPVASLGLTSATDPLGYGLVGLRYENAYESLAAGDPIETWGISVDTGTGSEVITASNPGAGGNSGVGSTAFIGIDGGTTATSTVTAQSGNFLVTHAFAPNSLAPNIYDITVTVTNLSPTSPLNNIKYRRNMDWDIDPTRYDEYVTIGVNGPPPEYVDSVLTGFNNPDPTGPLSGPPGPGTIGPGDYGAGIDFTFGTVAPLASVTFTLYYGTAVLESQALSNLNSLKATVYSLGENANTGGSNDPTVKGSPATFLFGFTRTPIISGGGDPWFTSFDGIRFPFHGIPGQVFNLVSEEDHLINALFVAEANQKHSALHGLSTGTWMAQIGFLYAGAAPIDISTESFLNLTVMVDNAAISVGTRMKLPHGCTIAFAQSMKDTMTGLSQVVTVETPKMKLIVWAPAALDTEDPLEKQETPGLDWNLAIKTPSSISGMHGIVGQTWAYAYANDAGEKMVHPEGNAWLAEALHADTDAYITSDLFAFDFAYNTFKAKRNPVSSRRKVLATNDESAKPFYEAGTKIFAVKG